MAGLRAGVSAESRLELLRLEGEARVPPPSPSKLSKSCMSSVSVASCKSVRTFLMNCFLLISPLVESHELTRSEILVPLRRRIAPTCS